MASLEKKKKRRLQQVHLVQPLTGTNLYQPLYTKAKQFRKKGTIGGKRSAKENQSSLDKEAHYESCHEVDPVFSQDHFKRHRIYGDNEGSDGPPCGKAKKKKNHKSNTISNTEGLLKVNLYTHLSHSPFHFLLKRN